MSDESVKNETHVVVSVYMRPGIVGPPLVHVYGPKTRSEAVAMRRTMLNEHGAEVTSGMVTFHTCKVLDIDAMNEGPSQ